MRICVHLADPLLNRALADLLRSHGHDVTPCESCDPPPGLRIVGEDSEAADSEDCASLVLKRTGPAPGQEACPSEDLEKALAEQGAAVWHAPLDTGALLALLGTSPEPVEPAASCCAPDTRCDLADAPYAWIVVAPDAGEVVGANEEARHLLDVPRGAAAIPISELPLSDRVRKSLLERSDGVLPVELTDGMRLAAWWTAPDGNRLVWLMRAPLHASIQEERNLRSLARLGRMAATLAHEIRNPLASVAGALDLLEGGPDPVDQREIVDMARQRLNMMNDLLEQTLQLARPIAGPPERVEVQSAIESAVSTLRLDPRFESVEMVVEVPVDPVEVLAYPQPLLQALTNLLLNAAQAQDGRGTIRIALTTDAHRALLRVVDEGPGVPLEKRREIFRPFYTTKSEGTGLGLAEVRRAMEAAGGVVIVEDVREGACFRLEIPLVAAP